MSEQGAALAARLIRNVDDVTTVLEQRDPLYETLCARLGVGTVAKKLGASIDIVASGKRSCPYHLHHAQEEMFIVLEGAGTLRVADEKVGDQGRRRDFHSARAGLSPSDHQ